MTETSIKLKLRSSSVSDKRCSLYIQLIYHRKVKTLTTPYKVYGEEWDASRQAFILNPSNTSRTNSLEKLSATLRMEINDLRAKIKKLELGENYSLTQVVDYYRPKEWGCKLSLFVDQLQKELRAEGRERTARAYLSVLNSFSVFSCGRYDMLEQIDHEAILLYERDLKRKGLSLNTISFYMRNLRSIYNKAVSGKLIHSHEKNLFSGVYTGVCKTSKRAVKKEVIKSLQNLNLSEEKINQSLQFTRDLFLFSFYMRGISFIDVAYLRKGDVRNGIITYTRKKTGQRIEVAITAEMKEIIRRYKSSTLGSDYLLPLITNSLASERVQYETALRTYNNRLGRLSRILRLEKTLTGYVSRHSWATIARDSGVPLSVISQGLGHQSERTTLIYLDSMDCSTLHKANEQVIAFLKKNF